jgi:hypothetical protein
MYPVTADPPFDAIGIAVKVIDIDVLVTDTRVGGLTGASGKSDAITSIA